jgi:succinate-semialdehyde dehydrogenase/glutarate-semialdehyde dehydrogenase
MLETINPATGEWVASYEEMSFDELDTALAVAAATFGEWRSVPWKQRGELLRGVASILRSRQAEYAGLMALEMGKPLSQGNGEIEKCARACEYFAEHGESLLADQVVATEASKSFVTFKPLGVVLGVMPWNFPFWQVLRYVAPTVMAGNTTVFKHASNVTGCALAIGELFRDAGAPGVCMPLRISADRVAAVIDDPRIAAVTLTGSTPAGRSVAERAGRALKKTVLELGGSDAYVILDDAPLEAAVETCVSSRLINSGQSCVCAKRFIYTTRRAAAVEQLFVDKMAAARVGDPRTTVDVGPLARRDLRDDLAHQVLESIALGARARTGGRVPPGPGAFYPPTVLTGVQKGMPAYDDELFGPVAALIAVESEAEALRVANDSPFGLGAAVFTANVARGTAIAADVLEAGNAFVNDFVRSDPRLPFGGVKQSGYGRELSAFGIREFVNVKTVWVK